MRKIIIIGECTLDVVFDSPVNSASPSMKGMPGGRFLNCAAILGSRGRNVAYVGEAARDRVGDIIVDFLESHSVETRSIDRFTEGVTPLNLYFPADERHSESSVVIYRQFPAERFDVVWPRIDPDDIVVFGTFFALDSRIRQPLQDLMAHAVERKAIIIYLPGFLPSQAPRITKVMPAILENMEMADIVLSRTSDLVTIFGEQDSGRCYERNIRFYSNSFINIDSSAGELVFFHRDRRVNESGQTAAGELMWHAGALAGLIESIIDMDITRKTLDDLSVQQMQQMVARSITVANSKV